ncbi:MAG: signal transduction histidine kinase [Xanthobacteraceae bacterium]|nr:signal transduction histidine kinase [Xanthobacteraceae bacterium]
MNVNESVARMDTSTAEADKSTEKVRKLLRQQAAVAGFGSFALRQDDLMKVLTEAARVCAEGLSVPFCKVCRYRPEENDLLIEAGYGWQEGVVGHVVSRADASSLQGRAFITGQPSICNDLRLDNDYELPPFYAQHGVVSTIDVIIKGDDLPYGVLEIDNNRQHDYDQHDIDFLTGFANVLAEAVATSVRTAVLQTTIAQMHVLVEEKDRLLAQKKILAEELQHRVRNNLQLVYGMLSKQVDDTAGQVGQQGVKAIARRVSTLAQVYDHLLGSDMTRTTDFGGYVKALCLNLAEIQEAAGGSVTLKCDSESLILDLDVVTALGLVVAELVTNSYEHAFPDGKGAITVSVHRVPGDIDMATMTISDNGAGFTAQIGSKRHGLGLVRRLMEQIRGTAMVASDHGTVWTLRFPTVVTKTAAVAAE